MAPHMDSSNLLEACDKEILYPHYYLLLLLNYYKFWSIKLGNGHINTPIEQPATMSYPIIQYADDILITMPADPQQISHVMEILQFFSDFTGLKVFFHRSSLVPINICNDSATQLVSILGCKRESMPLTYLGLPMGSTRPRVDDLRPMVSRLDKKTL